MMAQLGENDAAWIAADEPLLVWPEVCRRSAGDPNHAADRGTFWIRIQRSRTGPTVVR